jgi:hypothetical protein
LTRNDGPFALRGAIESLRIELLKRFSTTDPIGARGLDHPAI